MTGLDAVRHAWRRRPPDAIPLLVLALAMTAWLWPIGLGGSMPVGGDVTGFSIGLMDVLRQSLLGARLPLWNDLWGYGFPGLAESQMGVYYPPHWLFYSLLSTEAAYTASLVFHTDFAALGAYWAARRFGASAWGAAIGAWAFAAGGIFVVHLPHQWGYTVGSWMPWAVGLAWTIARGDGTPRTALSLAAVLALQVLPGHFQLAFETQVVVVGLAAWSIVAGPGRTAARIRSATTLVLACLAAIPLSSMQLIPTAQLAAQSSTRRGFEYLSGFAASPFHLVSYVAPGLFHRSPLWRPVAWDPFHTSPEEHLAYVGLVPLFLAILAIVRGRKNPAIRALTAIAVASLLLGLGPYVPGFDLLRRVPGFSFFRAPARWGLATSLAFGLLAAVGFDLLRDISRPGRSLRRFVFIAVTFPVLVVAGFELALLATEGQGVPEIRRTFGLGMRFLPWRRDPTFDQVMAQARRPQNEVRTRIGLAREGLKDVPRIGLSLDRERGSIYLRELGASGILLVTLIAISPLAKRRNAFATALVVLSGIDLLYWNRLRTVDFGPIRPLVAQSPILARLASGPRGLRSADQLNNLPMVARVAPIGAYRTLDLPVVPGLTASARSGFAPQSMRVTGSGIRVMSAGDLATKSANVEVIRDPSLASWAYGSDWIAGEGSVAARFGLWKSSEPPNRAWLVPTDRAELARRSIPANRNDAAVVLDVLGKSEPISSWKSTTPERFEVRFRSDRPALMVISVLDDPEWSATLDGPRGSRSAKIERVFGTDGAGAWMGIEIPSGGDWTIRFEYRGRAAKLGLAVSGVAWLAWILAYWKAGRRRDDASGDRGGVGVRGPGVDPDPAAPSGGEDRHGDLSPG